MRRRAVLLFRIALSVGYLASMSACSANKPSTGSAGSGSPVPAGSSQPTAAGMDRVQSSAGGLDNPGLLAVAGRGANGAAGGNDALVGAGSGVNACAETTQDAERVPVDMYIMLDRSDSMNELTGAGPSKWDAIRSALKMFLTDARSAGLGVGLQYFPIAKPGVPDTCTKDSDCGVGGPCFTGICEPSNGGSFQLIACATKADCPSGYVGCTDVVGECSGDTNTLCFDIGFGQCGSLGSCQRVTVPPYCSTIDSCDPTSYATPAVDIGELPDQAQALSDSLTNAVTLGLTPTSAALRGATQRAQQRAQDQPTHRVVAVLATDGLPTECDPTDPTAVGTLVQQALSGTPSISTYVIGVFVSTDTDAHSNLDGWAKSGGTNAAFIIDPTQDAAAQFLDALDKIRSGSIACEYQVPPSPSGSQLDYNKVNVALVESTQSRDILYVGDVSQCGATALGWYYDVDPNVGQPTKIVVCDQACNTLSTTDDGRVEIKLGCTTMSPE
jgi:hypothetical protein